MKIIQSLRKPYLSLFFASLIFVVSCSKYDVEESAQNKIDANILKATHQNIIFELDEARNNENAINSKFFETLEIEKDYLDNLNYLNEYGLEALFEEYNIDLKVISEFDFYLENESNEDIYQLLIDNFQINNIEEAAFLFNLFEVYNYIEAGLDLDKKFKLTKSAMQRISWSCAFAIAGTIATTAGAAFVTGGASLIVFLIAKGIGTAALIQACT